MSLPEQGGVLSGGLSQAGEPRVSAGAAAPDSDRREHASAAQGSVHALERSADTTALLGFWLYLMTDFVLFASLFAVLHANTFGGPAGRDLFDAPFVLAETVILLASSFSCGLSLIAAREGSALGTITLLGITAALGALFVGLELHEFAQLAAAGNGWWQSGFLSSYFTLVGTHGLHVSLGILWMLVLMVSIAARGLSRGNMRKLAMLTFFWHFLDIVWIFIFTIVYMMGIL